MGKVARPAQGPAPQERRLITQGAKSEQGRCTLHSHPAGGLAEAGGGPAPTLSHLLLSALPFLAPHGGSLKGPRALPAIARKCQAPPCGQQRWLLGVQDRRPLVVEVPAPSSGNVGTAVTSNFPGATFKKKKKTGEIHFSNTFHLPPNTEAISQGAARVAAGQPTCGLGGGGSQPKEGSTPLGPG